MEPKRLSVVVISRNEGEELRRTVETLDDTLPESAEIVVVDDGSTDGSADRLALRRGRVKLHRKRGLGVARARSFGVRHARGDTLVFAAGPILVAATNGDSEGSSSGWGRASYHEHAKS